MTELWNSISASPSGGVRPARLIGLKRKTKREGRVLQCLDVNELIDSKPSIINIRRKEPFNPFKKNEIIKDKTSEHDLEDKDAYTIVEKRLYGKISSVALSIADECANFSIYNEQKSKDRLTTKIFPLDWSLKTRIRFASTKPFPWRGCLKTCEESTGTTSFVRCLGLDDDLDGGSLDSSANARFHQQCLTWMHPSFPWLKLFPRMAEESIDSGKNSMPSLFLNNKELQETLHDTWCESFRSVYQLLRTQQCPFFYFCAPNFTALFRAGGVGGFSDVHAIITPTTSGLRRSLQEEGINFSMPLKTTDDNFDDSDKNFELPEDNTAKDTKIESSSKVAEVIQEEEPDTWLQSLGLSQEDFPSMNPNKRRKIEASRIEEIDGHPKSMTLVQGKDVQALFNFLLSNRHCTNLTGPLAGVPPTILAPCAFHSATLCSVKVRQGWVKHQDRDMHCIEVSGAILPNQVHGLCSLFSNTQEGQFDAVLANHKPTLPFSMLRSPTCAFTHPAFATANLKDAGQPVAFLAEMCKSADSSLGALSEIGLKDFEYSLKYV